MKLCRAALSLAQAPQSLQQSISPPITSGPSIISKLHRQLGSRAVSPGLFPNASIAFRKHASTTSAPKSLNFTPLYSLHKAHEAKMAPFAGFSMPMIYPALSQLASHHFTRTHSSLFDVSHMVQHQFYGANASAFLESITPSDLSALPVGTSIYSVLLWHHGGIADDCIITRIGEDSWYMVTNGATKEKISEFLTFARGMWQGNGFGHVQGEILEGWGLVALQGPGSQSVLENILLDVEAIDLKALNAKQSIVAAVRSQNGKILGPLLVTRGGYTGEDGFEIAIPPKQAEAVAEALLSAGPEKVQLAGLAVRDSLRLEAGMCLYGTDMNDQTTPVEASLAWVVAKSRRGQPSANIDGLHKSQSPATLSLKKKDSPKVQSNFDGAQRILEQISRPDPLSPRLVGLVVDGAPARKDAVILDLEGVEIGKVTSGMPSPTLGKNIALGYVEGRFKKAGTQVQVRVRGKSYKATVSKVAHYPNKYHKEGKGHEDLGPLSMWLEKNQDPRQSPKDRYLKAWEQYSSFPV